jgi:hypothetical protein
MAGSLSERRETYEEQKRDKYAQARLAIGARHTPITTSATSAPPSRQ